MSIGVAVTQNRFDIAIPENAHGVTVEANNENKKQFLKLHSHTGWQLKWAQKDIILHQPVKGRKSCQLMVKSIILIMCFCLTETNCNMIMKVKILSSKDLQTITPLNHNYTQERDISLVLLFISMH